MKNTNILTPTAIDDLESSVSVEHLGVAALAGSVSILRALEELEDNQIEDCMDTASFLSEVTGRDHLELLATLLLGYANAARNAAANNAN